MPDPVTREETFLAAAAGQSVTLPTPVTREELFLAKLAGEDVETPTPVTRKEMFLEAAAQGGGGGGASNFTLIGETVLENLSEWTDTANADQIDTGINISNTDYAWGFVVVTCDSPITTSTEWGMTVALFGRYTSNKNVYNPQYLQQRGSSTLSLEAMVNSTTWTSTNGVYPIANKPNVVFERKCSSIIPKIRSGNYTVKVYALTSL